MVTTSRKGILHSDAYRSPLEVPSEPAFLKFFQTKSRISASDHCWNTDLCYLCHLTFCWYFYFSKVVHLNSDYTRSRMLKTPLVASPLGYVLVKVSIDNKNINSVFFCVLVTSFCVDLERAALLRLCTILLLPFLQSLCCPLPESCNKGAT